MGTLLLSLSNLNEKREGYMNNGDQTMDVWLLGAHVAHVVSEAEKGAL